MLKINKILSKKIQFPLSLQGLFHFCHSRESGNPSSLSLRGAKQRSNLKGFSLIELMVAVVILSIALIGIFLAFSNTWMGMANARDRTVATNYAREAMENVKNMDFELVTDVNLGFAELFDAKFTRVIVVTEESANLKKIDTKVSWTNRQSQEISVETSMYINRTIFNPGEATHIILYADPYYTVLPGAGFATIIAAIKDINNTTVINWTEGDISFSIEGGDGTGTLQDEVVAPTNGIADTIFTGITLGDVVIMASVNLPDGGGTISDTITITVTSGAVRIALSAVPESIDTASPNNISKVTATLVDSGGFRVDTAVHPIEFNLSVEETFENSVGTPYDNPVTITPPNEPDYLGGTATIYVKSITGTPGVATVTASSNDLLSGTVDIIIAGDAASISVSVDPPLIYTNDEGAEVTLVIQDVSGNPVEFNGEITLSTSPGGTGLFHIDDGSPSPNNPYTFSFNSVSPPSITYSSPFTTGLITIIASGDGPISGNTDIEVREALIADTITLKANPKNILAGGLGGTEGKITATIKQGFTVISNYNRDITFEIILDTSTSGDAKLSFNGGAYHGFGQPLIVTGVNYGEDGVAVVDLKPAFDIGKCTIEVSTENSEGTLIENTIEVGFYSGEDYIELIAVPTKMLVDGYNCKVIATVVDEDGTPVEEYEGDITFTILVGWPKTAKFAATGTSSLTKTIIVGVDTTVVLIPQSTAGTVTLKASSFTDITDISGYLNIPVDINFLDLADPSNIAYNEELKKVSFDIEVQGTEISLEQMQVSWLPDDSETFNTIEIEIEEIVVYSNNYGVTSGIVVVIDYTLPIGISTIHLYFNELAVMAGKTFNIIFNSSSESYPVEFEVPLT